MSTLLRPEVTALLDRLLADARRTDAPIMEKLRALDPEARRSLMQDYRRLYGEARTAYLPVSREVGELLYLLARSAGARRIVEFGTSFGISTIFLAAAVQDNAGGCVVTSELEPEKSHRAAENLRSVGLDSLVELRTGDALDGLRDVPGPIDLVYLDGAKNLYKSVLSLLEPGLRPGALVIADNIDMTELLGDYTAHVRAPGGPYLSRRVVVGGDALEISLRL